MAGDNRGEVEPDVLPPLLGDRSSSSESARRPKCARWLVLIIISSLTIGLALYLSQSPVEAPPPFGAFGYVPALAEREWFPALAKRAWFRSRSIDGRICRTQSSASQKVEQDIALELAVRWRAGEQILSNDTHVSQMIRCGADAENASCSVEPIEPLTAVARHPYADIGCKYRNESLNRRSLGRKHLLSIEHLMLHTECPRTSSEGKPTAAPAALHHRPGARGRFFFFDCGCTVWSKATLKYNANASTTPPKGQSRQRVVLTSFGPSLPLFSHLYQQQCVTFDHMWGWEAVEYSPEAWWAPVPKDVKPRLTFINKPITSGYDVELNPLLKIAQVATVSDFVVVKLDIDMFEIENALIDEILTNKMGTNASQLIDELFFEYHFGLRERSRFSDRSWLMPFWGDQRAIKGKQRGGHVDHALSVMRRLRELGIRSHFWI